MASCIYAKLIGRMNIDYKHMAFACMATLSLSVQIYLGEGQKRHRHRLYSSYAFSVVWKWLNTVRSNIMQVTSHPTWSRQRTPPDVIHKKSSLRASGQISSSQRILFNAEIACHYDADSMPTINPIVEGLNHSQKTASCSTLGMHLLSPAGSSLAPLLNVLVQLRHHKLWVEAQQLCHALC